MSFVKRAVDNILNGISQIAPSARPESQAEAQVNAISWPERGLNKRPATDHAAEIDSTPAPFGNAFVHTINRDTSERYRVVIIDDDLKVYDELGVEQAVEFPNGKAYLNEALPNLNFRAATMGDFTFITHRGTVVAKKATPLSPAAKNEALVFVKAGDFDTTYRVKINGVAYTTQSAQGDGPKDRYKVGTQLIANEIFNALVRALRTTFTITNLGNSSIHLERINGADFAVEGEDGLAGEGLVVVKGKVQRFTDLPAVAKAGFVVEVTGSQGTTKDNFFVKYVDDSETADRRGVWVETLQSGEEIALDETTLPHVLIREGLIMEEIVALNEPLPVVEEDTVQETFTLTDGWSATQNQADPENGDVALSVTSPTATAFSNLDQGSSLATPLRVNFDVDARLAGLATCRLDIFLNTSPTSTTWNLLGSSRVYTKADGQLLNEFLVVTGGIWAANWDLKAEWVYTNTPCCNPGDLITCTLHGEDHAIVPGVQHNTPVTKHVKFAEATVGGVSTPQIYPKGIDVTVTISGVGSAVYTPTDDETGAQVATAIAPTINALGGITATDEGSGVVEVTSGSALTITAVTDYTGALDFFISNDLGVGATDLTGKKVKNLTDG